MTTTGTEIIFEVREADEGGYWAKALGVNIVTQGEDWSDLKAMIKDAVKCHFGDAPDQPKVIRMLFMREEVLETDFSMINRAS